MLRAGSHAPNVVLGLRARSPGIDYNASSNVTRVKTSKPIRAILFDKDGTLVDFQKTWGPAVHDVMQTLAAGHHAIYERLAAAIGFVESEQSFLPDSIFIAQPTSVWGPLWAQVLGCGADPHFLTEVDRRLCEATTSHLVPIGDPRKLMIALAGRGYRLGVLSNDAEVTVRAHARMLGVDRILHFVAGYDSGFGAKPDSGPVIAFANAAGVSPSQVAVVGDTVLDAAAAHAGGAIAVGVMTGPAPAANLVPEADAILASAEELLTWLDNR
jgi:phosphoglycolate phosphatase